jgi:hypothetical protein
MAEDYQVAGGSVFEAGCGANDPQPYCAIRASVKGADQ